MLGIIFNKCITHLFGLKAEIEVEDQAIILFSSLPRSYKMLVTTVSVGNATLTVDEVSTALLETKNMNEPSLSHDDQVLVMKSTPNCGGSMSR